MAPAVNFKSSSLLMAPARPRPSRELHEIVAAHGPSAPAEMTDAHGTSRALQEQRTRGDRRCSWPQS